MHKLPFDRPARYRLRVIAIMTLGCCASAQAADPYLSGEHVYANECARCHGAAGEGTPENPTALEGDYSVAQLAEVIRETMPEDDPGTLSAEDARAVAAYIHDAFYSAIARDRNRPARIELARLTVNQYRRAVADLIGGFDGRIEWGAEPGLTGEYFNSRQPNRETERVATRVDPMVDFDFGTATPLPEIEKPHTFSIRWSGSALAPDTGEYEFIIRTDHAARLWVNDSREPLIDAWVKSGEDTEYAASKFLVGGRPYALRLEFTKAKQGVNDSKKRKNDPPATPASVTMLWQRPGGAPEPIPSRFLSTNEVPATFLCDTPFPPDDRSYGWERGTAISPAWDEATTAAAVAAAGYVARRIDELAGTSDDDPARVDKLRTFARELAERAFRQPLDDELTAACIDRQFDEAAGADAAVRRVVLLVLKSPRFLFREIGGKLAPYDVAARLAFGLWDSIPDDRLYDAARSGELSDDADVRREAERMLTGPRAKAKLRDFLLAWLRLDRDADLSKNAEAFPGFDRAAIADLQTSLELFLDDVVWSDASDYRRLLLADKVFLNSNLASLYGVESVPDEGFRKVRLDDGQRAGVLTHPLVMARYAYSDESSPIHRGVFLARAVLGQPLRPPPEAFTPLAPELHPDLTTRERVSLQTNDAACMTCHTIINPLGFTLERFDAIGRLRDSDRGKAIDDTAEYRDRDGSLVTLSGPRDLAEFLATSEECHAAFVEQMFHHLVQQPCQAYGPDTLDELRQSFTRNKFNIRKLAVEIMVATTLVGRDTNESELADTTRDMQENLTQRP